MNVARSTFVRRGYLLTALAVAVLLAGFSVTAWAQNTTVVGSPLRVTLTMQTVPFSTRTLEEGADDMASTPGGVTVTITWSGTYDGDTTKSGASYPYEDVFTSDDGTSPNPSNHVKLTATCNDEDFPARISANDPLAESGCSFNVAAKEGAADGASFNSLGVSTTGAELRFAETSDPDDGTKVEKTIELYISDIEDDGDWDEETIVLTLELVDRSVTVVTKRADTDDDSLGDATAEQTRKLTATPRPLTLKINDNERKPTFKFDPTNIQLAKGNIQDVTALVGLDSGGRIDLPTTDTGIRKTLAGLIEMGDDVLLSVSPENAVGTLIEFLDSNDVKMDLPAASQGRYNIGKIGNVSNDASKTAVGMMATDDGIKLRIKAIDVSGFRDEQITLTLMEGRTPASKMAEGGGIDASAPATVTILSGEATPTVTFSTESIDIDEGESKSVHLLASGMQGDQVGSVAVRVRGEASISLEQNGNAISGGAVSFGGNANAELTIVANSDPSLEDGEEKTAKVTITDADGALIGDPNTVTVTVVGSTAVPVLPLFAQLLLALFLTVGGARLYRRRQQ